MRPQCADCDKQVISQAQEGHEPKFCGLCALASERCPWCGGRARHITSKKAIRGQRTANPEVLYGDFDWGWHCLECDRYYGIEDDGHIL